MTKAITGWPEVSDTGLKLILFEMILAFEEEEKINSPMLQPPEANQNFGMGVYCLKHIK